jgi:hypothetical protein
MTLSSRIVESIQPPDRGGCVSALRRHLRAGSLSRGESGRKASLGKQRKHSEEGPVRGLPRGNPKEAREYRMTVAQHLRLGKRRGSPKASSVGSSPFRGPTSLPLAQARTAMRAYHDVSPDQLPVPPCAMRFVRLLEILTIMLAHRAIISPRERNQAPISS